MMNSLRSADKIYNVNLQLFDFQSNLVMNIINPNNAVSQELFDKVSSLFRTRLQNSFTECELLMPLGTALKELFKRKIEALNLFYDDLPEVNIYYDQFIQELSDLRYKNWQGNNRDITDPFPTLRKIDQALCKVGVTAGIQADAFLQLFEFLFISNDLLDFTTGVFFFSRMSGSTVPVRLPLALNLCGDFIFQLRSEVERFLGMLDRAVMPPADFPEKLPFLNVPFLKSSLQNALRDLPTEFYLFEDFPGAIRTQLFSIFDRMRTNCAFLDKATTAFLEPIEAGIKKMTGAAEAMEKIDIFIEGKRYSFGLEQLKQLKAYYQTTFEFQTFFDAYINDTAWKLTYLLNDLERWRQNLPSKIDLSSILQRAANEMHPEEQQAEADLWLAELEKEKQKKQKRIQRRKAQPKGTSKKAVIAKKIELIRPPSPEKSIVKQPHPVLYGLISGVQGLHIHAFAALRQAYVFEGDLKLIQRKVTQGGLDQGQMTALFLSTVRTSYLYLEQLFRSLKQDQAADYAAERTHDLYSFGPQFVELNPSLIENLFLGNFWVDYAEDHIGRWKKSGGTINRTTPAFLTRSERAFKRGFRPIDSQEITNLIGDVFETKSRWLKTSYSDQALGTEDLKEGSFSLTFPKLSFVQINKHLQALSDQKILGSDAIEQQRRILMYLEETLKGADEAGSSAENSYRLRTALHLMHLAIEWGFEQYGQKQGLRDFKDHNLLQLAKNVGYPLTKNKEKYLRRFFQLARPLSSYPYDLAERQCDLIPLILKLDYKANYALHQKDRPLFPKINLSKDESGKLVSALVNGFVPLLGDVLKSLQV